MEVRIPIYDDTFWSGIAYASSPILGEISDSEKNKIIFDLSSFVIRISNRIISYTQKHLNNILESEQNNVAFAFLQRAVISQICNHKLSCDRITIKNNNKYYALSDEYKTMPLTRSVYEHLAMFYYIFRYSDDSDQREIIWNSWKLVSKRNLIKENLTEFENERQKAMEEYILLCDCIRNNTLAKMFMKNHKRLFESCLNGNTVFTVYIEGNDYSLKKLSYEQAWKYLYGGGNTFSLTYNYLSMHSHPTYDGLAQFYSQNMKMAFPLYESCHFLSYLSRLFIEQLQIDKNAIIGTCSEREKGIFSYLSNERNSI